MENQSSRPLLIGSTFPLSLIRRPVRVSPRPVKVLWELVRTRPVMSFWGHANTLAAANRMLGIDLTPAVERPALVLDAASLPTLAGRTFEECWVLSPDYAEGFRPGVGQEVPMERIRGWQVLLIEWR
jgi:hypothetical protein